MREPVTVILLERVPAVGRGVLRSRYRRVTRQRHAAQYRGNSGTDRNILKRVLH